MTTQYFVSCGGHVATPGWAIAGVEVYFLSMDRTLWKKSVLLTSSIKDAATMGIILELRARPSNWPRTPKP